MKKFLSKVLCTGILITSLIPTFVVAEEDYSDTEYWENLCTNTSSLTIAQQTSCKAYAEYIQKQNAELKNSNNSLGKEQEELESQISEYASEIEALDDQIADLSLQIESANAEQAQLQIEIVEYQTQIENKQEIVDNLKRKVSNRMVASQSSMRTSSMIEVLMGAKSFSDFLRILSGLSVIYESDSKELEDLTLAMEELLTLQEELENQQSELAQLTQDLVDAEATLSSQQSNLKTLKATTAGELATKQAEQAKNNAEVDANNSTIQSINNSVDSSSKKTAATPTPSSTSSTTTATPKATSTPKTTPTPTPAATSTPSSNTGSSTNPSYTYTSKNPYPGSNWNNCTWSVWQLVYENMGIALPRWGNAGDWLSNASAQGWSTGSTPAVYAVMVQSHHVAWVTAINGDMVYIKEGNYLGHYKERWVNASGYVSGQYIKGYIYLN